MLTLAIGLLNTLFILWPFQYQFIQVLDDTIPPMITCPSEVVLALDDSGNLNVELKDSIIILSDNCGMVLLDYFPSSFTCSDLGTNIVTITASDATGNFSTCEVPVIINEGPKIVQNLLDDGIGSLRYLIEVSCGGAQSIIYFDTALIGSIDLFAPQFLIDRDIEIVGLGKDVIDINANNIIRIFQIDSTSTLTLRGLQLSNAESQMDGGAILNYGTLNLDDIRFIGNNENNIPKALTNNGQIKVIGGVVEIRQ